MKKRDALIRYLSKHIDKIIIGGSYGILLLFILAMVPGILYQERLIREGIWQEYRELGNDSYIIIYALNTGDNKPLIRTLDGDELIAVDGFKSTINVNDVENRSFWNHHFRNVVEKEPVMHHNMIWENYQFLQVTTLQENAVTIDYSIKCSPAENIKLTLNLWHRYQEFSVLKVDNSTVNDNYPGENQPGLKYVVNLELDPQPQTIENAPYWINLTYSFDNLAVKETWGDPIVRITIFYDTWEGISD